MERAYTLDFEEGGKPIKFASGPVTLSDGAVLCMWKCFHNCEEIQGEVLNRIYLYFNIFCIYHLWIINKPLDKN